MKKTNTYMRIIAVTLGALAMGAAQARAAATVLADEIPSAAAVSAATATGTNNVSAAQTGSNGASSSAADNPSVRIDETGVHVGGPHPVDIDAPRFKSRHPLTEHYIDVVGIVGVVFGCAVPIAIVAIIFYFRHRRLKMHHETMRAMIDKGMPIPPEMIAASRGDLLLGNSDVRPGRSDARSGLILVAVGAGLLMFAGKVGWILVFIGAARLVLWLMDSRN